MTPIDWRTPSDCFDDVEAVDQRRAGGRRQQRDQHADQRRLAGAVRAEQAEDLPFLDGEADAVDGGEVAELLDDVPDVDRVHTVTACACTVGAHRLLHRQQHVGGHAHGEPAILVVDAQPDLERLDVALGAADVALRREAGVGAAVEDRARRARRPTAAAPSACRRGARDRCSSPRRRRGPTGRRG